MVMSKKKTVKRLNSKPSSFKSKLQIKLGKLFYPLLALLLLLIVGGGAFIFTNKTTPELET